MIRGPNFRCRLDLSALDFRNVLTKLPKALKELNEFPEHPKIVFAHAIGVKVHNVVPDSTNSFQISREALAVDPNFQLAPSLRIFQ